MNDEEIEKMAKDLTLEVEAHCWADNYQTYKAKNAILKALRTVRDSVVTLPSREEFHGKIFDIFQEKANRNIFPNKHQAALEAYDWLRTQLKTVQPISDEELDKLAQNYRSEFKRLKKDDTSHTFGAKSTFITIWRAAEARILGGTK